ncbi:hypothetical protein Aph02nite_07190 [Actinoplanes philippinensis]|nr:hypothetical protein Aph02nite_07190 [Actinoplanes philippinensis]
MDSAVKPTVTIATIMASSRLTLPARRAAIRIFRKLDMALLLLDGGVGDCTGTLSSTCADALLAETFERLGCRTVGLAGAGSAPGRDRAGRRSRPASATPRRPAPDPRSRSVAAAPFKDDLIMGSTVFAFGCL